MRSPARPRCPYCLADLATEWVVRCASCRSAHHRGCFLEHGRCTLLGCNETRTVAEDDVPPPPGSLHPFLPVGDQPLSRSAVFLSVSSPERDRRARRVRLPALSLKVPERAAVDEPLSLELIARTPAPIRGEGLRLRVRSELCAPEVRALNQVEAVIAGRPSRGWLQRLKLWRKQPPQGLVGGGVSRWTISFAPRFLAFRGPLPAEGQGPLHRLFVSAHLEGQPALSTAEFAVPFDDGRLGPKGLPDSAEDARVALPDADVRLGGDAAWRAARVLVNDTCVARAGVRQERALEPVRLDSITIASMSVSLLRLVGVIELELHRAELKGSVELDVVSELYTKATWKVLASERVVLVAGTEPGSGPLAGLHRLSFDYPLPPVLSAGRRRSKRRVWVSVVLRGEGLPLRDERVLDLPAP